MSDLYMLRGGVVIRGDSWPPDHDSAVLVRCDRIEDILSSGAALPALHDYRVIDITGKYLMPSLINAHLHLQ